MYNLNSILKELRREEILTIPYSKKVLPASSGRKR